MYNHEKFHSTSIRTRRLGAYTISFRWFLLRVISVSIDHAISLIICYQYTIRRPQLCCLCYFSHNDGFGASPNMLRLFRKNTQRIKTWCTWCCSQHNIQRIDSTRRQHRLFGRLFMPKSVANASHVIFFEGVCYIYIACDLNTVSGSSGYILNHGGRRKTGICSQ